MTSSIIKDSNSSPQRGVRYWIFIDINLRFNTLVDPSGELQSSYLLSLAGQAYVTVAESQFKQIHKIYF